MTKLDRHRIVDAALGLVQSAGLEAMTLSEVARHLDVTQPALYYHVEGVDELWRHIGLEVRRRLASDLTNAAAGRARGDALRAVGHAWRAFSHNHPSWYRSTERFPVEADSELEAAVGLVLTVLGDAMRGFELGDDDRASAALALRATLHGFASFELGGGNPARDTRTATEAFDRVLDMTLAAIEHLERGRTAPS